MNQRRKRPALELSREQEAELLKLSKQRIQKQSTVLRAKILLAYSKGKRVSEITKEFNTTRPVVERCIDKALSYGPLEALNDLPRSGRKPIITDDAKAWVISLACTPPKEFGYATEIWTYSLLVKHILTNAENHGHTCLKRTGKSGLAKILKQSDIRPHKISYYLEKRDPEFDVKMANVLCLYK